VEGTIFPLRRTEWFHQNIILDALPDYARCDTYIPSNDPDPLYMTGGNAREADRWFRQAESDLVAAKISLEGGCFDWACFQAQQSAAKAMKSVLYAAGYRKILTHSLYELLLEYQKSADCMPSLEQEAKLLDNVYITSRYPNGLAGSMIPSEYYTKEDADRCLHSAGLILDAVQRCMPR